jgi:hypothetical protein
LASRTATRRSAAPDDAQVCSTKATREPSTSIARSAASMNCSCRQWGLNDVSGPERGPNAPKRLSEDE